MTLPRAFSAGLTAIVVAIGGLFTMARRLLTGSEVARSGTWAMASPSGTRAILEPGLYHGVVATVSGLEDCLCSIVPHGPDVGERAVLLVDPHELSRSLRRRPRWRAWVLRPDTHPNLRCRPPSTVAGFDLVVYLREATSVQGATEQATITVHRDVPTLVIACGPEGYRDPMMRRLRHRGQTLWMVLHGEVRQTDLHERNPVLAPGML